MFTRLKHTIMDVKQDEYAYGFCTSSGSEYCKCLDTFIISATDAAFLISDARTAGTDGGG